MSTSLRALCEQSIEDDAKATKGPWTADIGHFTYEQAVANGEWIANARTREPALARALLLALDCIDALRSVHKPGCLATVPVDVYAKQWKYGPCECGRDKAVRAFDNATAKETR